MILAMFVLAVLIGMAAGAGVARAYYDRGTFDARWLRWSRDAAALIRDLTYTPDALDLRGRATRSIAAYEELSATPREDI